MKLWSRFCFLVLAVSSFSRGQTVPSAPLNEGGPSGAAGTSPPPLADQTQNETLGRATPSPSPLNETPGNNTADLHPAVSMVTADLNQTEDFGGHTSYNETSTSAENDITSTQTTTPVSRTTGVTTTTAGTSAVPVAGKGASSWGYVILGLIILVIIILCVILYILRRVSRMYSFDLQRPSPVDRLNEPIGTFEPVYLDDLDRPSPKENTTTDDLSSTPVANGTTLPPEENSSSGENAPQEQPEANGVETSPASSPSVGADPADKRSSPLGSTILLFDITGEEQQNGNNNNPSVCSSDPFVEINLDDPAWGDQLLTSPEAPSSVLPFSPFSFSSSSSSSS